MIRKYFFSGLVLGCFFFNTGLHAQQRMDPEAIVKKENELIFAGIEGLTDKQKEKITKINEDFAAAASDLIDNRTGNRQEMREKMQALRQEKEKSMQEVFTGMQFEKYKTLMADMRNERRDNRKNRRNSRGNN